MSKPVKTWGQIGGVTSVTRTWSAPPSEALIWSLYTKMDDYTETTYSGPPEYITCVISNLPAIPPFNPENETMRWRELTLRTTGTPLQELTVREGCAYRDYGSD